MVPARLASLRDLDSFLGRFRTQAGLSREDYLRLNLVVEELFTNTVRHGLGEESDAPVWVALADLGGETELVYEDCGPPFNPYAGRQEAREAAKPQAAGGLGILLVKGMAAEYGYAYVFGRNCIRLRLARRP